VGVWLPEQSERVSRKPMLSELSGPTFRPSDDSLACGLAWQTKRCREIWRGRSFKAAPLRKWPRHSLRRCARIRTTLVPLHSCDTRLSTRQSNNDSGGCVGMVCSKSTRSHRLCRSTSRARPFPITRCPPCTVPFRLAARCSARHCTGPPRGVLPVPSAHVETRWAATCHACRCLARWSEFWESSCAARNSRN
jgi:hypothetical protein